MTRRPATRSEDERFMEMACKLAARGRGRTRPNPMVGAVVVQAGKVVGAGHHRKPGSAHAEVVALERAGPRAAGATLYVNLEPCAHHGKTPPCVDRIVAEKIRRVVVGTRDTNPLVDGKGIRVLRSRGVQVTCGVLEERCRRLNEAFFKHVETGKPFVTLKAALSLDGKIASRSGASQWISCPASRKRVHRFRSRVDAVLVGLGTVIRDDPRLTVRDVRGGRNPLRVVMDSRLRIPEAAAVLGPEAKTLVATTDRAPARKIRQLENRGVHVEVLPPDRSGRVPLGRLLRCLGKRDVQHLLVEGGAEIFTSILQAGEGDELLLFVAPLLLGGREAPGVFEGRGYASPAHGLPVEELRWRRSGRDLMLEARLARRRGLPNG